MMSQSAMGCLLALSLAAAWSQRAQAQPESAGCAPPAAAAAAASKGASTEEQVAALYQSFACHFARKEYAACLPYLEQACRLTDSPRCPLNLGAVHHALMHCQLARGYYQQYLDRSPYDEDVEAARHALEELERACPRSAAERSADAAEVGGRAGTVEEAGLPALPPSHIAALPTRPDSAGALAASPGQRTATPVDAPSTERRQQSHVLAWSLLGAGAASLTATVVLATYGARAERDYEARAAQLPPPARSTDAELRTIDERGERSNQAALVLGVLSGLLTGTGATLWITDGWRGAEDHAQSTAGLSVFVSPDGTALSSYSGSF
jgi:hypothetical protein